MQRQCHSPHHTVENAKKYTDVNTQSTETNKGLIMHFHRVFPISFSRTIPAVQHFQTFPDTTAQSSKGSLDQRQTPTFSLWYAPQARANVHCSSQYILIQPTAHMALPCSNTHAPAALDTQPSASVQLPHCNQGIGCTAFPQQSKVLSYTELPHAGFHCLAITRQCRCNFVVAPTSVHADLYATVSPTKASLIGGVIQRSSR